MNIQKSGDEKHQVFLQVVNESCDWNEIVHSILKHRVSLI